MSGLCGLAQPVKAQRLAAVPVLPLPRKRCPCSRQPYQVAAAGRSVQCAAASEVTSDLELTPSPEGASPDGGPEEWKTMVGLAALVAVVCSVDRAALSVAILPMSTQFGWDDTTKGLIGSAFFFGYMITNFCGGYLATRYAPKTVLSWGVVFWSIFTLLTPIAAEAGDIRSLLVCRMVMGMGEGVTFPCIQNLIATNVPAERKSRSLTIIYSGVQTGTIISLIASPWIISSFDWQAVFYIFGATGFVWLLAWLPLVQDAAHNPESAEWARRLRTFSFTSASPQQTRDALEDSYSQPSTSGVSDPSAPAAGSALAAQGANAAAVVAPAGEKKKFDIREVPWGTVLRNKPYWSVFISHAAWGFGHYACLSWLPSYYFHEYGLNVRDSALVSALPWVVTVGVTNFGGWGADQLVNREILSRVQTRKALQLIASIGPAACLLYLAAAANHDVPPLSVTGAVALLVATLSLAGFTGAGFASNHQDLTTKYTGILFGITNAASSAAGSFSTYATGVILDRTDSWSLVFETIAIIYIGSSLIYAAWASSDNQFDDPALPSGR